jgi:N-glycosylase/DNA lyase
MEYKMTQDQDKVIIEDIKDFEPKHIFECGQCFRWHRQEDGSYTGVAMGRVLNVKKEENRVVFSNTNLSEFKDIWYNYFDLDRDYGQIKRELSKDDVLKQAIPFGEGIRILKQEVWETLISFIVSANNRIPMIKKGIELMSQKYGTPIGQYQGQTYYSFPTPDQLKNASYEELKECKVGFRGKYILSAAYMVSGEEIEIKNIHNLVTEDARKNLIRFNGVGPKVADCIMLFSMDKQDAFPVDVWVKRVMEHFYLEKDIPLSKIQSYAKDKFGDLAGFAQQYLFYYARDMKGKEIV